MCKIRDSVPFEDEFESWMRRTKIFNERTIKSRISNVKNIDRFYGPLTEQWKKDNFNQLLSELEYTKTDKASGRPNPSLIPIDGDIYDGLATYKSALNLYRKFFSSEHFQSIGYPFGEIGFKVNKALERLSSSCIKRPEYSIKEVKSNIIEPLIELLDEELGCSMQYTFSSEVSHVYDDGSKSRDRYDIIGQSKDRPVIIVEVDTHRSDQMAKKVVSRIAMNSDKEVLYVCVLYPNTHINGLQEIKECVKYIDYLKVLFSILSDPQKSFMEHWLCGKNQVF